MNPKKDVFSGDMIFCSDNSNILGYLGTLIPFSNEGLVDDTFFLTVSDLGKKSAGSLLRFIFMEVSLDRIVFCYSIISYKFLR